MEDDRSEACGFSLLKYGNCKRTVNFPSPFFPSSAFVYIVRLYDASISFGTPATPAEFRARSVPLLGTHNCFVEKNTPFPLTLLIFIFYVFGFTWKCFAIQLFAMQIYSILSRDECSNWSIFKSHLFFIPFEGTRTMPVLTLARS